jgi:hypothetical protein
MRIVTDIFALLIHSLREPSAIFRIRRQYTAKHGVDSIKKIPDADPAQYRFRRRDVKNDHERALPRSSPPTGAAGGGDRRGGRDRRLLPHRGPAARSHSESRSTITPGLGADGPDDPIDEPAFDC